METRARKQPDGDYLLSGAKNWITNSPIADVLIVWAKDDNNDIRGFILDRVRMLISPSISPSSPLSLTPTPHRRTCPASRPPRSKASSRCGPA